MCDERCGLCMTPSGSASPRRCGLLHPAVAHRRTLGGGGSDLRPLQRALAQARQSRLRAQPAPRRHDIHPLLTGRGDLSRRVGPVAACIQRPGGHPGGSLRWNPAGGRVDGPDRRHIQRISTQVAHTMSQRPRGHPLMHRRGESHQWLNVPRCTGVSPAAEEPQLPRTVPLQLVDDSNRRLDHAFQGDTF